MVMEKGEATPFLPRRQVRGAGQERQRRPPMMSGDGMTQRNASILEMTSHALYSLVRVDAP